MPNVNRDLVVPGDRFARARWLDENLPEFLKRAPLHLGIAGVREIERQIFPSVVPLDPTCPQCGVETDDGRVELDDLRQVYRVTFESCGHVLEMTRAELEARCQPTAKS